MEKINIYTVKVYRACTNKFSQLFISRSGEQPEQCFEVISYCVLKFKMLKCLNVSICISRYFFLSLCHSLIFLFCNQMDNCVRIPSF